ncbi:hypothetical protein HMPREF2698_05085 [Corynebacterium sp. HMSC072A02]|nr:hypothetical protein HMPREF2698_05085 [Corynebacterium sp. HMSC072A02]
MHKRMKAFGAQLVFPRQAELLAKRPWFTKSGIETGTVDISGMHDAGKTQDPRVRIDVQSVPHQEDFSVGAENPVKFCTGSLDVNPMPGLRAGEGVEGGVCKRSVLGSCTPARHPEAV